MSHTPTAVVAPDLEEFEDVAKGLLSRHFALWRALRTESRPYNSFESPRRKSLRDCPSVIYPFRARWTGSERLAWKGVSESLEKIRDLCHSANIRFVVMLIPAGHQLGPDVWKEGKQLMGYSADEWEESVAIQAEATERVHRLGLELIDLLPVFRDTPHPADLYYPFDGHWTPLGHQTGAKYVLSRVTVRHT